MESKAKAAERMRKLRAERAAKGQCRVCKDKAVNKNLCAAHVKIAYGYTNKYREKSLKESTCIRCPRPLVTKVHCEYHKEKCRQASNRAHAKARLANI